MTLRPVERTLRAQFKRAPHLVLVLDAPEAFPVMLLKHRFSRDVYAVGIAAAEMYPLLRPDVQPFARASTGLKTDARNWLAGWSDARGRSIIVASAGEGALCHHWAVDGTRAGTFNAMSRAELDAESLFHGRGDVDFWDPLWQYINDNSDILSA